jgi:hypothetical protein
MAIDLHQHILLRVVHKYGPDVAGCRDVSEYGYGVLRKAHPRLARLAIEDAVLTAMSFRQVCTETLPVSRLLWRRGDTPLWGGQYAYGLWFQ